MNRALTDADLGSLEQILGSDNVSSDKETRELYSQDIWAKGKTADFIISPQNTEQLSEAVKIATRGNIRLNPRGAGMSYTEGYIPTKDKTGILDLAEWIKFSR